uniref:Uncharacterized protein n=1 Tax=Arundo donax TaxID=35708 RepID=A0A0A9BY66_ARUDO
MAPPKNTNIVAQVKAYMDEMEKRLHDERLVFKNKLMATLSALDT